MDERMALDTVMCSFVYVHVISASVQAHVCECSMYVCMHTLGGLELTLGCPLSLDVLFVQATTLTESRVTYSSYPCWPLCPRDP